LCGLLFFHRLAGRELNSSHEARAAQNAQTILDTGDWGLPRLLDRRPELQKPPLYYWLVAALPRPSGGRVGGRAGGPAAPRAARGPGRRGDGPAGLLPRRRPRPPGRGADRRAGPRHEPALHLAGPRRPY